MKISLLFSCVSLFILASFAQKQGIDFKDLSLEQALIQAKNENKIVFVAATADWCGTCKFMKKNVFPSKNLESTYNEALISVEFDVTNMVTLPEVLKDASWETLPALIYLNGDGEILKITDGIHMDSELIEIAKEL